jgi:catechol 2,3-dioxygenase-like lactoylglutathione lyase family enzyme
MGGKEMAAFRNTEFEFGGFNHLALTCSDMQRTVDFYTNILGMKLVKTLEFTNESGSGQHFFFDVGNGRDAIAFFWFDDAPPPVPGIVQSGRWLPGAPRRSAIGAMDHVALDVPPDKIEAYRDKLRARGVDVTEVVNHSDRPGISQYLPAEPNEDTFVRSIYFQDPDGITLEFACWGRPLTAADVVHEPKTAADLNPDKQAATVRQAQAAAAAAGMASHAVPTS